MSALRWISPTTRLLVLVTLAVEGLLILGTILAAWLWVLPYGSLFFWIAVQTVAIPLLLSIAFSLAIDAFAWLTSRP